MTKRTVVFDLDGTLLRGDSFVPFLFGLLKQHPARIFKLLHLPLAVLIYKFGMRNNTWLKVTFLRAFLRGRSKTDIEKYVTTFVETLLQNDLRPAGFECLQKHQRNSDHVILATASPDIYVRKLAEKLSFDQVICTELGYYQERFTGLLVRGNCYGNTKLQLIEDDLGHTNIDVAYSDHEADLPLLNAAKKAIAVNPNKALAEYALVNGLSIENWN